VVLGDSELSKISSVCDGELARALRLDGMGSLVGSVPLVLSQLILGPGLGGVTSSSVSLLGEVHGTILAQTHVQSMSMGKARKSEAVASGQVARLLGELDAFLFVQEGRVLLDKLPDQRVTHSCL